jgi:hypothetical protein
MAREKVHPWIYFAVRVFLSERTNSVLTNEDRTPVRADRGVFGRYF